LKKQQKKKDVEKPNKRRSVSKQGRKAVKSSKGAPSVQTNTDWDALDTDLDETINEAMDYTFAQDEGKTNSKVEELETSSKTEEFHLSGDTLVVKEKDSVEMGVSTAEPKDGNSDESAAPATVFRDDETIAEFLPLPKIDPKDKDKKVPEEEDDSDAVSEGVNEVEKKFKMLANDEEMARKVQEEWEAEEEKKRSDENFIAIGSVEDERLIKDLNKKAAGIKKTRSIKKESKEVEGTKNRKLGTRKKMKSSKRRFRQDTSEDDETNSEKENDELRLCLTIAPDEDKEVDYEILNKKYHIIEWKSEHLGIKPQYNETKDLEEINLNVVIRSSGQRRYFSTLMRVLSIFDRDDLNAVYQLVMDKYKDEIPEGFDRVLWGDLMIMFNPSDKDEFWNSQQDWNVVSWKLHGSSGVHTLMTDEGLVIHMLVEKQYPLRKNVLVQMLELKLESEEDNTMALELIRFVKKLIAELEPENSDGDEKDL
ncbi:hypothetical protein Tco_1033807, partial [Tanacetum coccineum]